MNYFAHAFPFLGDAPAEPYFVAGTAVPDWLAVLDRRVRVRSNAVQQFLDDEDPRTAALAAGVLQHLRDDRRFHDSRAFAELSLGLTAMARDALGGETGMRPAFLGHLLVEVLLDASLVVQSPERLERYYQALDAVDAQQVQAMVSRMAGQPAGRLAVLIEEFRRRRVLSDYLEDGTLMLRLDQVMRRVGLDELPDEFRGLLPAARLLVEQRREELLAGIPAPRP